MSKRRYRTVVPIGNLEIEFKDPFQLAPSITIETVRDDPEYRSIRLQDVSQFREKLESIQGGPAVAPSYLWDVPVATDTLLDESLILDSNRTLVRLLRESNDFDFTVPVVEIRGENMGRIVPDFEILARRP